MKQRKFQCFSASVEAVISADSILLIADVLLVFNFFFHQCSWYYQFLY